MIYFNEVISQFYKKLQFILLQKNKTPKLLIFYYLMIRLMLMLYVFQEIYFFIKFQTSLFQYHFNFIFFFNFVQLNIFKWNFEFIFFNSILNISIFYIVWNPFYLILFLFKNFSWNFQTNDFNVISLSYYVLSNWKFFIFLKFQLLYLNYISYLIWMIFKIILFIQFKQTIFF